MSETDQQFGQAGVESSQGFHEMPSEAPEPSQDSISSSHDSLREQADKLSERRDSREDPPDIISYRDQEGKRTDRRQTVTRERAAEDLAGYREQKTKAEEQEAEAAIREHVDSLRRGGQQQQNANAQPQFSQEQVQAQQNLNNAYQQSPTQPGELSSYDRQLVNGARDPQVRQNVQATQQAIAQRMQDLDSKISQAWSQGQPWQELGQEYQELMQQHDQIGFVNRAQMAMEWGYSPKVASAIADREVLEWVQQATKGYEDAYQAAVEKHENNCMELIGAVEAAIAWMFPELAGAKDVKGVINAVRQSNPQRADDLSRWYGQFERAVETGLQSRQRGEQEKREKFSAWAANQDNLFRSRNTEFISPETQRTVALEAFEYLESKGITRDEVIKLHDQDELFRSHVGQEILWEAMQFRRMQKAKAGLREKLAPAAPGHVLRPGSSEDRIDADRSEKLPSSMNVRDAAAILERRRARRR